MTFSETFLASNTAGQSAVPIQGGNVSFPGVIQGSNFVMRPPRVEEAEVYRSWFADREVTRWLMRDTVPSLEEETEWVKARESDSDSRGWCIEYQRRPVGVCGADSIDWIHGSATTGTIIGDKSVWGKGIGSEMMRLRRDWFFGNLPIRKLCSGYVEGNVASGKAQAKAGYQITGRMREAYLRDGTWYDTLPTEILRSEWEARKQEEDRATEALQ
jgi:ribosomal-protein-alanine N-acetyltransferase